MAGKGAFTDRDTAANRRTEHLSPGFRKFRSHHRDLNSSRIGTGSILVSTIVESAGTPPNPSPSEHSRWFDFRLAAAVILLLPAIWFSCKTVDGLAARRLIRTDLAEITHVRYGILSADQWRGIIGPILNAQVDKLDLKGQSKSLRPMVERSLYDLLDHIKTQMTSPNAKASGMPGGGNADDRQHDHRVPASACAGVHGRGDGGVEPSSKRKRASRTPSAASLPMRSRTRSAPRT